MDIKSKLVQYGVPEELHSEALGVFARAKKIHDDMEPIGWLAPFVMLWVCFGGYPSKETGKWRWKWVTNWEDNKLPDRWWKYDNNVSMNGDGWGMILPDGTHTSRFSREEVDSGQTQPIQYEDPAYKGDAYYCKGHHPRSRIARYVWMGWRNRGSLYALYMGAKINPQAPLEQWGVLNQSRTIPGGKFTRSDGLWQYNETGRKGIFETGSNLGFKIGNARTAQIDQASVVWNPLTIRLRKKE